jgi:hypothetical protein
MLLGEGRGGTGLDPRPTLLTVPLRLPLFSGKFWGSDDV